MTEPDPGEALAAVRATRARLVERARWSTGRHLAFGGVMGALVASYALPSPWPMLGVVLCAVVTAVIVRRDRARDGFFINGYRKGRTRTIAVATVLVTLGALALAAWARTELGLSWPAVVLGVLVAGAATAASRAWERAYRADLRDGGQ